MCHAVDARGLFLGDDSRLLSWVLGIEFKALGLNGGHIYSVSHLTDTVVFVHFNVLEVIQMHRCWGL